ncbi:hypothetical protein, partial [Paraburkholderia sp. SIMBA_030]|uniref:hypothetical protein n=1 Tax=Paraburkholderia sp. SIMBA_030 TaxID=3085773 RepID=UPI00397848AB
RFPALFVGAYPTGTFATAVGCVFAVPTVWMMLFAAGLVGRTEEDDDIAEDFNETRSKARSVGEADEDDGDDEGGWLAFGALT